MLIVGVDSLKDSPEYNKMLAEIVGSLGLDRIPCSLCGKGSLRESTLEINQQVMCDFFYDMDHDYEQYCCSECGNYKVMCRRCVTFCYITGHSGEFSSGSTRNSYRAVY